MLGSCCFKPVTIRTLDQPFPSLEVNRAEVEKREERILNCYKGLSNTVSEYLIICNHFDQSISLTIMKAILFCFWHCQHFRPNDSLLWRPVFVGCLAVCFWPTHSQVGEFTCP